MLLDLLIPSLLCIVIASVIDTACFQEDCCVMFIIICRKGHSSKDAKVLLSGVLIWVNIAHGQKHSSLAFVEVGDLTVDGILRPFNIKVVLISYEKGLFRQNACALGDCLEGDETFSLPWDVLKSTDLVSSCG